LTKQTTNVNLSKPEITDKIVDTITQLASNFDVIDLSLAEKAAQADLVATNAEVALKANKSEITNSLTPKGNVAYASLPTTGNTVGWYYYCSDGINGAGNYVWNGTAWYFGGTNDNGYSKLNTSLGKKVDSFTFDDLKTGIKFKRANLYNKNDISLNTFPLNTTGATMYDFGTRADAFTSNQIFNVKYGDVINCNIMYLNYYLYDSNGVFLERLTDGAKTHTVTNANAKYMRFMYNTYSDGKYSQILLCINSDATADYNIATFDNVTIETTTTKNLDSRILSLEGQKAKTKIIMCFDDMSDMYTTRLALMKEYGFRFSFCLSDGVQVYPTGFYDATVKSKFYDLLNYGCDVTMYGYDRYTTITTEYYSRTVDEWIQLFTPVIQKINSMGFFPVTYQAKDNTITSNALAALKKLGFVMGRSGVGNPENNYYYIEDFDSKRFNTPFNQIQNNNLDTIKSRIDFCIQNGYSLSIFTHQVVDNNTSDLNCDTIIFRQLLDYIKSKVDANLCEVVTYQEFFNQARGHQVQQMRNQQRMNFIESKIV
jgi:hypothetical protein